MPSVLFVVTAADHWTLRDGTLHPTGYWAEELAEPHRIFAEAGWEIALATPGGVAPTLDELSLGLAGGTTPWRRRALRGYLDSIRAELDRPRLLAEVDEEGFDLVFYPGGHGPMEDLAVDETSGALLTRRLASGRPLALLCHGPAALLAAKAPDGSRPFAGYRMTALSNLEERINPFAWKASWLLEDRLCEEGAVYRKGTLPLRPFVVSDRNLHTGQNPQSADKLARKLLGVIADEQIV